MPVKRFQQSPNNDKRMKKFTKIHLAPTHTRACSLAMAKLWLSRSGNFVSHAHCIQYRYVVGVHFSAGTSHSPVDKSGCRALQRALKIRLCLFHVHLLVHNFCLFFIACFSLCICFVIAIVCNNIVHFRRVLGARERARNSTSCSNECEC